MSSKARFERDGYVVLRGLLSKDETRKYRLEIQKLSGIGDLDFQSKHFECADGVSKNAVFWPLIFNPRLLGAIREILGPSARYTQHSDLHAHRIGGWHRDCACRKYGSGPDWQPVASPYKVVRVAIYLQTYAESGSALGVIPGSHRPQKPISARATGIWLKYRAFLNRLHLGSEQDSESDQNKQFPWIQTARYGIPKLGWPAWPVWIKTEPGDTVIFDQRCYHSASPLRGPKYAIYLSYSPDDEHASNHLCYYTKLRPDLKYAQIQPELAKRLKEENLYCEPQFTQEQEALLRQHCHIPAAGKY
jgi:Phytanoyl-CoA dioxygenase (PhyH)